MSQHDQAKMEYLRTKVMTASPEELHLMLYDGAIRFTESAKQALRESRWEDAHEATVRAQNIVLEMSSVLDRERQPDLCAKMASLYNFVYRRLVEANLKHDAAAMDDALKILNYQRETWVLLMDKLVKERQEGSGEPAGAAPEEAAEEPAERISFSVSV
jgi:flagellar secretion chaperone FliS